MATEAQGDTSWADLSRLETSQREAQMNARYEQLVQMEEPERASAMKAMAEAEYALQDDQLRQFTLSRMRTLLQLSEEDARTIIASYDGAMRQLPATMAMRRVALVQSLSLEFSAEDEERLRVLVPTVFGGTPRRSIVAAMEGSPTTSQPPAKQEPWWAFWRK